MEPLYKGQVGSESFVPYAIEPLYKGHLVWGLSTGASRVRVTYTKAVLENAQGTNDPVTCKERV